MYFRIILCTTLLLTACRGETEDSATTGFPPGSGGTGPGGGATGGWGASGGGAGGPGGSNTGGTVAGDFILQGTVLTPDIFFEGQVLVEGGTITCAAPGTACQDAAPGATVVDTGGVIAPGLIDTHNHILFDIFNGNDWSPNIPASCSVPNDCSAAAYCGPGDCDCVVGRCYYTDHDEWPKEREYALMLDYKQCLEDASQGKPAWCPQELNADGAVKCEMDKWGELKAMIAGTTSVVGLPGNSSGCFSSLSRSIDVAQNDLGEDKIQTSALFPPSATSANGVCTNFADGDTNAYLIHNGEGVTASALAEFQQLYDLTSPAGCLYAPQTTITHATSYGPTQFAAMAQAGMKLTWSPASNVFLYGTTTDIPAALAAGVLVSLAPDWSMGGSQNLLDELRFARTWSDANWGGLLTDEALVHMVTTNAAEVLALSNRIGRLDVGMLADIIVVAGDRAHPYSAVVNATPASIDLVMIGGVGLYGSPAFQLLMPATPGCESRDVCGASKRICVAENDSEFQLDQTLAVIESTLETQLLNLDSIQPLAPSACNNSCSVNEECFVRTVVPQVNASNCPATCAAGEACFQTAMSGDNQFNCLSLNACAPAKNHNMAPLAPLVACN